MQRLASRKGAPGVHCGPHADGADMLCAGADRARATMLLCGTVLFVADGAVRRPCETAALCARGSTAGGDCC